MIPLTILIVEDVSDTRDMIRYSIEKFNTNSIDIKFTVIGEANSYDSAADIILREDKDISLVLLDIKLIGKRRNGYDIIKDFPDLSYAIISQDDQANNTATNNLPNPSIYFFQTKKDEVISMDELIEGLGKFVQDKRRRGDLYTKKIRVKGIDIYTKRIALISKNILAIKATENELVLDKCPSCEDPPKARVYFYSNKVKVEDEHNHLHYFEFGSGVIDTFVEDYRFDPEDFVVISQSTIVNLNYIKEFHHKSDKLILDIICDELHKRISLVGVGTRLRNKLVSEKIDRHLP